MTALLWVVTNQTSAIVFACFWVALIVSLFSRIRRKHHEHP
jgi:general stress protein CsbA